MVVVQKKEDGYSHSERVGCTTAITWLYIRRNPAALVSVDPAPFEKGVDRLLPLVMLGTAHSAASAFEANQVFLAIDGDNLCRPSVQDMAGAA